MNLELLESLGNSYPEEADGFLDPGATALCVAFNRWGSLLSVGTSDGRIFLYDFITRGPAKAIAAHVMPVCSLSWSRSGRQLLSASADNTVCLWNVLSGDCERRFRFPSPILRVQFHPRDSRRFIVCPIKMPVQLVNATNGSHVAVPTEEEERESGILAIFERKGRWIITGNGKGRISIYSSEDLTLHASFRLAVGAGASHPIKSLEAGRRGQYFVTNSGDRIIRVWDLREILLRPKAAVQEPVQKLQDLVNKTAWKTATLSGDGEYVCAGSSKSHSLYIWERKSGSLVKILNGTKGELLLDLEWHPARPLICSVSNGLVSVWSQSHVENWSAFAPDFKELDENVEYSERESEFDLEDEDRDADILAAKAKAEPQEEEIDVVSVPNPSLDSDSDMESPSPSPSKRKKPRKSSQPPKEEEEPLWFLPVAPDVENPEENPSDFTTEPKAAADPAITFDISLSNAPKDEVHPLLGGGGRKRSSAVPSSSSASRLTQPKTANKKAK